MTFLEIRQRVAEVMGIDSTDTTTDANATIVNKLKEWVNARYRYLAGKRSWNWRIQDAIVQTQTEITSGTVSVTHDSANITFSSSITPDVVRYWIQFEESDDWYEITTHGGSTDAAVLTTPFVGTTNAASEYTLRKVYYNLPATVGKILDAKQTRDDIKLTYISPREMDRLVTERQRTGEPEYYSVVGLDPTTAATAAKQWRIEFYPTPDAEMNIVFRHYLTPTELSADGDIPIFPEAFHEFLVWDTLGTYGFMFLDDTRLSAAQAEANRIYKDMIANDVASENIPVRQAYDVNLEQSHRLNYMEYPITEA